MHRPAFTDDLDASLAHAWALLVRGATDRRGALHTPVLATIGLDGRPQARTVVLRAADPAGRLLRIHTDSRSPKVAELRANPAVSVLGYDPADKIQLRLEGRAAVERDTPATDAAWDGALRMSRACYAADPAPGTPIAAPDAFDPGAPDAPQGRAHFAIVLITVERLDWLYLAHGGHRRAAFELADGAPRGRWLAP